VSIFGDRIFELKMNSLGWGLMHYNWCPYKKRLGHRLHSEGRPCEDGKTAIYKPRKATSKERNLAIPCSQTSGLQKGEEIKLCCLTTQSVVLRYVIPRKLKTPALLLLFTDAVIMLWRCTPVGSAPG
jgi:hypothetical protein